VMADNKKLYVFTESLQEQSSKLKKKIPRRAIPNLKTTAVRRERQRQRQRQRHRDKQTETQRQTEIEIGDGGVKSAPHVNFF